MAYLVAGPFVALVGIMAVFFVLRRKSVAEAELQRLLAADPATRVEEVARCLLPCERGKRHVAGIVAPDVFRGRLT